MNRVLYFVNLAQIYSSKFRGLIQGQTLKPCPLPSELFTFLFTLVQRHRKTQEISMKWFCLKIYRRKTNINLPCGVDVDVHLRSMNLMSLTITYCFGRGLGAGDRTVSVFVSMSTFVLKYWKTALVHNAVFIDFY